MRKYYEEVRTHEQSISNISNVLKWRDLLVSLEKKNGADSLQKLGMTSEEQKWREILKCLLEVTLFLAKQNLVIRGSGSTVSNIDKGLWNS